MRNYSIIVAGLTAIAAASLFAESNRHKSAGPDAYIAKQTTCPVTGDPVKADVSVDYEGQQVLFCCKDCIDKFKADPMKYLPVVYKQVYPQHMQTRCPIMNEPANPALFVEHNGERVYLCCKGCDRKFKANPAKYEAKLAEVRTEQVHCPVTGELIDPAVWLKRGDSTVYFCCPDCMAKFKADSAKYEDALQPTAGLLAYGKTAADDLVLCPVCLPKGGGVHKRSQTKAVEHGGLTYALCNDDCVKAFTADPAKFVQALRADAVQRAGDVGKAYTCSKHPDIVRNGLGRCPLCGAKLTPVQP